LDDLVTRGRHCSRSRLKSPKHLMKTGQSLL
jgi:hypothetical protein